MIKNWLVTGDTHGHVLERLSTIKEYYKPEETAVIILGDAGLNFFFDEVEERQKEHIQESGFTLYCVRGNHEERPENIGAYRFWDFDSHGLVYRDPKYSNINYFIDGNEYEINGRKVLAIGGAYSVDKEYRLRVAPHTWFADEQLTDEEMSNITKKCAGHYYDFVFTHTCPYSWQPTDLFLHSINQSTVDNTMELWLEDIKNSIDWTVWLFGHFHQDRLMRPGVEMYYRDYENLENIWDAWTTKELPPWVEYYEKDPNYYKED
jgi:3-oxoacid CoA-transferase subunit A